MNKDSLGRYCGFFCAVILFLSLAYAFFLKQLISYPSLLVVGIIGGIIYTMIKGRWGEDNVIF